MFSRLFRKQRPAWIYVPPGARGYSYEYGSTGHADDAELIVNYHGEEIASLNCSIESVEEAFDDTVDEHMARARANDSRYAH